jgi:hypothetical protein
MGVDIEKWGSWTPHKYKIAVSRCPRNCEEATIEDAYYLERTAHWIERVGLEYVKKIMFDDEKRKMYAASFVESQRTAQVDPWKESIDNDFTKEFNPIVINTQFTKLYSEGNSIMANWIKITRTENIPAMGSRKIVIRDLEIAVFKTKDGSIFAVNNECPHKQGNLSECLVHENSVTCPLHN